MNRFATLRRRVRGLTLLRSVANRGGDYMFRITLLALAASFGFMLIPANAANRPKRNIVILLADDMGYADAGFQGCKDVPTPPARTVTRSSPTAANRPRPTAARPPHRAGD